MDTKSIALAAIYASVYIALSLLLSPISYGAVQIRLAGLLLGVVPLLGLGGVIGQTVGCLIVNLFSPLGLLDLINVVPTFIMALVIWKFRRKNVLIGSTAYSLVTSASIAATLFFAFGLPFPLTYMTVLIGQLIACVAGGFVVNKSLARIIHTKAD